jgi:ABC-type transport system involved in cytochrome bd biosynthesis fused ATPase/permease subunit
MCVQIIVLDKGVIAERGTHDELLERDQEYAKLWNMQIRSSTGPLSSEHKSSASLSSLGI